MSYKYTLMGGPLDGRTIKLGLELAPLAYIHIDFDLLQLAGNTKVIITYEVERLDGKWGRARYRGTGETAQ